MREDTFTCPTRKRECHEQVLFESLHVWDDLSPRSGPENMALDEWLLTQHDSIPVLRLYRWQPDWISLGYFSSLSEAQSLFGPSLRYVRRWTGGGVVDHRQGRTYSLIVPRDHPLTQARPAESYASIHGVLARFLATQGVACSLTAKDSPKASPACFQKPVRWDLVGPSGKLAGAAQRRTRFGLLHQGSVMTNCLDGLGEAFATQVRMIAPAIEQMEAFTQKYQQPDWLTRCS